MRGGKENLIVGLSIEFVLNINEYCEVLEEKKNFVISRQLLKSGTSTGANVQEAQFGESMSDFIHKKKISAKEADETKYWLTLCERSPKLPHDPLFSSKCRCSFLCS
jgi:four helix bundle protein